MAAAPTAARARAFLLAAAAVLVAGQFCIVAAVPPGFMVSHNKFS
jgi:hypothetical protein